MMSSTGGGGGYGDVLDRDPRAVARDIREKMTTADVGLRIYGVVLDERGDVDERATDERRAEMRRERLARGKPFSEFIGPWLAKRPPENVIAYYGHFPEPRYETYAKPFWGLHHE
jgi:acetone carboxylase alpha subunit